MMDPELRTGAYAGATVLVLGILYLAIRLLIQGAF